LLVCRKPAICGAVCPKIVIGAPRTIGRDGFLKADDGRKHAKDEHENPHGNLSPGQNGSGLSRQNSKICGSQTTDSDPGIFIPAFATMRGGLRRTLQSCRRRCVGGTKSAFDATRTFRPLARFPRMNFFRVGEVVSVENLTMARMAERKNPQAPASAAPREGVMEFAAM
jgi:hypothetical protein